MNKLLVDKENNIEIKDNAVELDIQVTNLTLNIKGKVLIKEISKKDTEELNLTINVEPNSSLIYNRFIIHNKADNKIKLIQQNNSKATLNYSLIANDKVKLSIDSSLSGDNNETEIKIAAVTEQNGSATISSTADVLPNIKENNLYNNLSIIK